MARIITGYHITDTQTGAILGMYNAKPDQAKRARTRAERLNLAYGAHRYSANPVFSEEPAPRPDAKRRAVLTQIADLAQSLGVDSAGFDIFEICQSELDVKGENA